MDIFFCTGEKSSDILAGDIYSEFCKILESSGDHYSGFNHKVDVFGIVGKYSEKQGIKNLLRHYDISIVGYERQKYRIWKEILELLSKEIKYSPPKVFVGVTHHLFNLPLAKELPKVTRKLLISPPEIWGWQANLLVRLLYRTRVLKIMFWFLILIVKVQWLRKKISILSPMEKEDIDLMYRIAPFVIYRGKYVLKYFDKILCLLPFDEEVYRKQTLKLCKSITFVGHPASKLNRKDFEMAASSFRKAYCIPFDSHMLNIFPGSREGSIKLLLPTMLEVAVRILNKYENMHCHVSIADSYFIKYINDQIMEARKKIVKGSVYRLSGSETDATVLLTTSSYALLSSGTITLYAACLGVLGTVLYDLPHKIKLVGSLIVKRIRIGPGEKQYIPFALPNALLSYLGYGIEKWPYKEFVLPKKGFNISEIEANVDRSVSCFSMPYSGKQAPILDNEVVEEIRRAILPRESEQSPQAIMAKEIFNLLYLTDKNK